MQSLVCCSVVGEPDIKLEPNLDVQEDEILTGGIDTEFSDCLPGRQDSLQTDIDLDTQQFPSFSKFVLIYVAEKNFCVLTRKLITFVYIHFSSR